MKSIVAFVAILALGSAFLFNPNEDFPSPLTLTISGNQTNLQSYFNALWSFYDLPQQNASNCFNNVQANAYFASIGYQYQYLGALMQGSRTQAALYAGLLQTLNTTLSPAMECMFNNTDFFFLMYQAGVTTFNRTMFDILTGIYFQGRFDDYYLAYNPVFTQLFDHEYSEAGYTYGPILYEQINNASSALAWSNAIGAFENALFFDFNISSPTEFSDCYNDNTARTHLTFYYLWTQTVANSTVANVVANTQAYFNGTGRALFEQIEPTFACLDRTNDQWRLDAAVGTQLNGPIWWNATHEFLANNPNTYYTIFNQMYTEFEHFNPGYAGFLYGTFIYAVNATINN